jgi:hypothetical protein
MSTFDWLYDGDESIHDWIGKYRQLVHQEVEKRLALPIPYDLEIQHTMLALTLKDHISKVAIPRRRSRLWDSKTRRVGLFIGGISGPLGPVKTMSRLSVGVIYTRRCLSGYGLLDANKVKQQMYSLMTAAGIVQNQTILEACGKYAGQSVKKLVKSHAKAFWTSHDMTGTIQDWFHDEFHSALLDEGIQDIFHLIPAIGHGIQIFKSWDRMESQLIKVLDLVTAEADQVHQDFVYAIVREAL